MSWKKLLQHISSDMGSFAIDFHGVSSKDVKKFLKEVGLTKPDFAEVARFNRIGQYQGWVAHHERYDAYEAANPIVCHIKVFDFEEAREICCELEETFHNISLEEVLNIEY